MSAAFGLLRRVAAGRMMLAMVRLSILLASILLTGCAQSPAQIPVGCYRFSDGRPFLRIEGSTGTFVYQASVASFKIGNWRRNRQDFVVTPAFVLHDGSASAPAGPDRMADLVTTIPSGKLRYQRRDGQDILVVPLEAFGEVEVFRGGRCP